MISSISITPASSGYENLTRFTFTPISSAYLYWEWDMGNGVIFDYGTYNISSVDNFVYTSGGTYNIKVTAWEDDGLGGYFEYNAVTSINVEILQHAAANIEYIKVPSYAHQGTPTDDFVVSYISTLTSGNIDIALYAENSESLPYASDGNKWKHLRPNWCFYDTSGNIIETLSISAETFIYNSTGGLIGTSGIASFYYKDDMPKDNVNIYATLLNENDYVNSQIMTVCSVDILELFPTHLKITKNGVVSGSTGDIDKIKWVNHDINYVISIHGSSMGRGELIWPILFNYPSVSSEEINISFNNIPQNCQFHQGVLYWSDNPSVSSYYFKDVSDDGYNIGGIIRGKGYSTVSTTDTQLSIVFDNSGELIPNGDFNGDTNWSIYSLNGYTTNNNWLIINPYALGTIDATITSQNILNLKPNNSYTLNFTFSADLPYGYSITNGYLDGLYVYYGNEIIKQYEYEDFYLDGCCVFFPGDLTCGCSALSDVPYISALPPTALSITFIPSSTYGNIHFEIHGFRYQFGFTNISLVDTISGQSNTFDILPFETPDFRKYNEAWDGPQQIRDYALPDHINANENLFENFIGNIVGHPENGTDQMGVKVYEKTANFVNNNADIDECNIIPLYSNADKMDVPIDDYKLSFPSEIQRVMDIISIHHDKLWGARCQCNKNFGNSVCEFCNHSHTTNLGDEFDPWTYQITGGIPFVVKDKYTTNAKYELITPSVSWDNINTQNSYLSVYNLADVNNISWLLSSEFANYYFFNYNPTICNYQVEGVIDWDNEYTTLSQSMSSLSAWYGQDEQIDQILSYYLYKGLQLGEH